MFQIPWHFQVFQPSGHPVLSITPASHRVERLEYLVPTAVRNFCRSRDTPPEVRWHYSSCRAAGHSADDAQCFQRCRETTRRCVQWPSGVVAGGWTERVAVCHRVTWLRRSHTGVCISTVNPRRGAMMMAAPGNIATCLEHCTAHLSTENSACANSMKTSNLKLPMTFTGFLQVFYS